ncbi:hypothetical protein THRCLA_00471 [Thraustotheca clavata]|uniref:Uncharacterized protein n=1 Tax=Thraustotheca clavata TaxID=74557 RepID=A0A1W0AB62_9STRA|nr:hypothetical protein THRCLA_00471 [Thraustotheca clavata]
MAERNKRLINASPTHVDCTINEIQCKRLTFTTATIYEFDVEYGGSALPSTTGPPIGLSRAHKAVQTIDLNDMEIDAKSCLGKYEHLERITLLKKAGYQAQDIALFCLEAMELRNSRTTSLVTLEKRKANDQISTCKRPRLSYNQFVSAMPMCPDDVNALLLPCDAMACMVLAVDSVLRARSSKHVAFDTATTYTFEVAYGGSALPKDSGPPIGMARTHCMKTIEYIKETMPCGNGKVRKFDHLERIAMLKSARYDVHDIAAFCLEAIDVRKNRMETQQEWTKLQRKRKLQAMGNAMKRPCCQHVPTKEICTTSE